MSSALWGGVLTVFATPFPPPPPPPLKKKELQEISTGESVISKNATDKTERVLKSPSLSSLLSFFFLFFAVCFE